MLLDLNELGLGAWPKDPPLQNWLWCPHCHMRDYRRLTWRGLAFGSPVFTEVLAWHHRIKDQMWDDYQRQKRAHTAAVPLEILSDLRDEGLPAG